MLPQEVVQEVRLEGLHATVLSLMQRDHDRILAASSGLDPAVAGSGLYDVGPVSAALQVRHLKLPSPNHMDPGPALNAQLSPAIA